MPCATALAPESLLGISVFHAPSAWDGLGTTATIHVTLSSLSCRLGGEICKM